ncbi:hypothetical protein AXF15_02285 [Desulfomicrobium orale DSM 12838]|uniref:Glycoside hydrolase 123 C-terminal domain-containing protein n=2 Tax=Desulfomicrobium orale TaxID=132132 RepID=A0A0X8JNN4_9BACT|nr:hypothetical protein AXF15_02285 [Desulfomicrobium orale DSM 12838]
MRSLVSILLAALLIFVGNISICKGEIFELIKEDHNFAIYARGLMREQKNSTRSFFKAKNEKLIVEVMLLNKNKLQISDIFICRTDDPADYDNNYDVYFLLPWYKDGNSKKSVFHSKYKERNIEYEILAKDHGILKIDKENTVNLIKVDIFGSKKYINIEKFDLSYGVNKKRRIPHNAKKYFITDKKTKGAIEIPEEQILYIFEKESKKINELIIGIELGDKSKHTFSIPIITIPLELIDSNVDTAIYYRGIFHAKEATLSSEQKTRSQLETEFRDMLEKGIQYPTVYLYDNKYREYMKIRNELFPKKDKIFIVDSALISYLRKNDLLKYKQRLMKIKSDSLFKEYKKIYFYLIDEPDKKKYEDTLNRVLPILKANGVGIFLAGKAENFQDKIIEDVIYILAYEPSEKIAEKFHQKKAKIYSYANPQVGIFKPEEFRINYGFKIIANKYDGIMPYAYQDSFGSQWSDFDSKYRDHMLTYPISDGLLNTIHGVALQNAITDLRYASTYKAILERYMSYYGEKYPHQISLHEVSKYGASSFRSLIAREMLHISKKMRAQKNENH